MPKEDSTVSNMQNEKQWFTCFLKQAVANAITIAPKISKTTNPKVMKCLVLSKWNI